MNGRSPIRLSDNPDPEALRLQQPANNRHAEAGMIDVSVADDDDVAGVLLQRTHFCARHRQEGRNAKTGGPVFTAEKERGSGVHEHPEGAEPITKGTGRK